ncbi:MAG: BcepIL02 gp43 [Rhizobium sp.]|nr:BcepIL02 gp43 [Rhizobium sp.]
MLWRVKAKQARLLPAKFIQPCLGVDSDKVPTGEGWIHEIKHDGYRMQVRKDGARVRLFTRRGFDWTERYPRIVAAARRVKAASFTMDGETVCVSEDGIADFARLHSRCFDREAIFYAFDLMEFDGADMKPAQLIERKERLRKLIRRPDGIHFVEHDTDGGTELFRAACELGIEGIVSKRAAGRYMPGPKRCQSWRKTKNKRAPGYLRVRDGMEG